MSRDKTICLMFLSIDVAKEGCPKFNHRLVQGLNQGPPNWLSEILPTALTSLTLINIMIKYSARKEISDQCVASFNSDNPCSFVN